jgi:hypothetical protein
VATKPAAALNMQLSIKGEAFPKIVCIFEKTALRNSPLDHGILKT